jgi:regulator of G-protein signaling
LFLQSKSKSSNISDKSSSDCGIDESNRPVPPLIAKWRNGVKLQLPSRFDGDGKSTDFLLLNTIHIYIYIYLDYLYLFLLNILDLYEGLKRAQRLRLDDQRGIEINFELPEFLKVSHSFLICIFLYFYNVKCCTL